MRLTLITVSAGALLLATGAAFAQATPTPAPAQPPAAAPAPTPAPAAPTETPAAAGATPMSFFITSAGPGDGGNLGGLEGADAHCQMLADAAGAGNLTWAAYLSAAGVNARDRIGSGPWANANGVVIAASLDELHADATNLINKENGLTETGAAVPGRGEDPNQHDILTGSTIDGMLAEGQTCNDWTSNMDGTAMVGHFDRAGPDTLATATSWNAAHPSRGCSQEALISTGGNGYFYCFATDAAAAN